MGRVVVIDGLAGAGKSTTAMELAKRLGFAYLDTGAMYRAMALKLLSFPESTLSDEEELKRVLANTQVDLVAEGPRLRVYLDGVDVTDRLRQDAVDSFVSQVAAQPLIREFMQARQRQFAQKHDVVAEGRDLASYVFPDAEVKIFMVADLEERARRRAAQKNDSPDQIEKHRRNLVMRDQTDSARQHSPLKRTPDAYLVDTTNLTFEQQVEIVYDICRAKLG